MSCCCSSDIKISETSTHLNFSDTWGAIKARWAINRNNYKVNPGLYSVGKPDESSDVFVTANYKLSFDHLRKNLNGLNAWILILNTKGINVWCAAGKGTFGTEELISKIRDCKLEKRISHNRIILPQLGAVGISAHQVKNETGFKVIYGPVRAADIKPFINNRYHADEKMRTVNFTTFDRLILTPVEITGHLKYFLVTLSVLIIAGGFNHASFSIDNVWNNSFYSFINLFSAYITGTVITPAALPWVPSRNFAIKGLITGTLISILLFFYNITGMNIIEAISWSLINISVTSFLTMNFTGASTFTSLSGVKKEMKLMVPVQITLFLTGILTWIILRFL